MANQPFSQLPTGVWSIMSPVKGRAATAISLGVLSAFSSLTSLLTIPFIAAELLSDTPAPGVVWRWVGLALGLVVIAFTSRIFSFRVSHVGAFNLEVILRMALADHLAQVPLGYVITTGSGAVKKLVQDDVKALDRKSTRLNSSH